MKLIYISLLSNYFDQLHVLPLFFSRHRHSFIGNNFEKVPRNESTLTRYQTSIALDQMECNSSVDSTMNSLDMKQVESEEITDSDICKNQMMDNSANVNIESDYNQSATKFIQKVYFQNFFKAF